jgi:DNA-binding beta-propeller fold protein YncE
MLFDAEKNIVFASHPGAMKLTALDLATDKVTEYDTEGAVNGIAVDAADKKVFVAGGGKHVIVFDRATMKKIDDIPLTGPADDILFDPKNDTLYVDHDDASEVWAIDAKDDKIDSTIVIGEAPEYMQYEPTTDRIYQNIKSANHVEVIDPNAGKVIALWPTAPMTSPHGLAIDAVSGRVFSAGKNGKLVVLDIRSGAVVATVNIAPGTDQIAFDPGNKRVYCPANGTMSVVQETDSGATLLANVPIALSVHTLAVNPATHDVWVSYPTATGSFLQKYTAR